MKKSYTSSNITADGTTTLDIEESGLYEVHADGTWGSGTLTLKRLPIGGSSYVNAVDSAGNTVSFTADGIKGLVSLSQGKVQFSLSGSTSPSLYVTLVQIV